MTHLLFYINITKKSTKYNDKQHEMAQRKENGYYEGKVTNDILEQAMGQKRER